jgi:D-alanyl-lipoteichoic acid acyltransferase DltB (MBOAT superfamily)
MLFPTLTFGLFFLALFALAWIVRTPNEWRKIILLVASWIFYGAWDWRFVTLLIASGVLNWFTARAIHRTPDARRRRLLLTGGVVANLTILGVFKYYGFFFDQVSEGLRLLGWARDLPVIQVILPVGVSFFTFQGMSYLIDVSRGRLKPASLLNVTLLMSFFAHLIAGPIVRGADLIPQFERGPQLSREAAALGVLMIIWGLFKKAVLASELATGLVDPVFFDPSAHSAIDLIAATYGYAVQIYADFSAYSDMAIGLAALLGYRFPRNFDQPYRSISLQEFWRRWHISLSSWLRDYLYIPLGGSRGGFWATCRNVMITMVLGGLWHGAAWKFVTWGALHGTVLCIERIWTRFKPAFLPTAPKIVGLIVTFHIVCLAWIFFRADSFATAIGFIQGFGRWDDSALAFTPMALGLIVFGLALHASPPRLIEGVAARVARLPALAFGLSAGALILFIDALRPEGVQAFIYYQF